LFARRARTGVVLFTKQTKRYLDNYSNKSIYYPSELFGGEILINGKFKEIAQIVENG